MAYGESIAGTNNNFVIYRNHMLKAVSIYSDSEELTFTELQDVLTYFIKYENRHQMKNTLAMINPVSCQVTQVVADNVQLDRTESESILDEEDFISSHEDEKGQKLPVYINNTISQVIKKYTVVNCRHLLNYNFTGIIRSFQSQKG